MLIHIPKINTRSVTLVSIMAFSFITILVFCAYDVSNLPDKGYLDQVKKYPSKNNHRAIPIELSPVRFQKRFDDLLNDLTVSKAKLGNTFDVIDSLFSTTLFTANQIINAWHSINSRLDSSPLSAPILLINTIINISGHQFDSAYRITGGSSQKKPEGTIASQTADQNIEEKENPHHSFSSRQHLQKGNQENPTSTVSRKKLMLAYLSNGDIGQTIDNSNQKSSFNKKDIRSRIILANTYMNEGEFDKALEILKDLERELPDNPEPFNELGNLYIFSGKVNKARNYYKKSLEKDASYVPAKLNLARMELNSGKPNVAKTLFEEILSNDSTQKNALVGLAEMNIKIGHKKDAMKELGKVSNLYPDFIAPRIILAQIYLRDRNILRAKEAVNEAIKINPENQKVQEIQGMVLLASGNSKEALKIFKTLVASKPTAKHYFQLAQAQRASTQLKEAISSLTKGLKIESGHMPSLTFMAFLDLSMGKPLAAMKVYNKIIIQQPNNVIALNNLALLSLESNKNRALELAKQAYKLNKSAPYADTLGWVLLKNGKVKQSLVYLRQAHHAAPTDASTSYHLAVALAGAGNKKEARKILDHLVTTGKVFYELNDAKKLLVTLK